MHLREVHLKVVSWLLVLQREALPEAQFLEDFPREHVADASEGYLSALGVAGLHAHLDHPASDATGAVILMDTEQEHHEELVCFLFEHVIHYVLCDAVDLLEFITRLCRLKGLLSVQQVAHAQPDQLSRLPVPRAHREPGLEAPADVLAHAPLARLALLVGARAQGNRFSLEVVLCKEGNDFLKVVLLQEEIFGISGRASC